MRIGFSRNKSVLSVGFLGAAAAALILTPTPSRAWSIPPTRDLNVKTDCGAAGNGRADDTRHIQSCIGTAASSGQGVYFPPGTYKVTAALTITSGNMLLYGTNSGRTRIVQATARANLFTIANGGKPVNQVTLRQLELLYAKRNPTGLTVYCDNCWRGTFTHVIFGDPGTPHLFSTGLWVNGGNQIFVEDSEFDFTASQGMYFRGTGDVYLSNLEVNDSASDTTTTGLVFDSGVGGIYATNVNVTSGETGYLFENTQVGGIVPQFGFFTNCLADTLNGVGWDFEAAGSMRLTNSWAATGFYGVIAKAVTGLSITDSRIYNNSQAGIWLDTRATDVSVKDSTITRNSRTSPGADPGILVAAGVGRFQILGNEIGAADGFGSTQSYGVLINGGSSDNFMIVGNDLQNNMTGEYRNGGSGIHALIKDNL
ncbi:MAG: glycosyl hydrolase family 28-related protein [Steroidobacteraceae bacterium]